MTIYKVTTELKTTWWLKALRSTLIPHILRKKNRKEFEIFLNYNGYKVGDVIRSTVHLKIIDKEEREGTFVNNLGFC